MKIGLIGLPKSGKTTIFNALSGANAEVTSYATGKTEPNIASIAVKDPRITKLSQMYNPKKTTYATLELADFVGVAKKEEKEELFSADLMRLVKTMNALGIVLVNFQADSAPSEAPQEQLRRIEEELLLSDQIVAERRIDKIHAAYKTGQKSPALQIEKRVLLKALEALNNLSPIRSCEFTSEENKALKGFQFLTQKPCFAVINSGEKNFGKSRAVVEELGASVETIEFCGSFEMELSRLTDEQEALAFMADMGITESARDRCVRCAYQTLGYINFFTVGDDEVRAWEIPRGASAVDAAAAIHTDLARGFVRAECFTYDDLTGLGSEKAVKEKGKFRLEGKEYAVRDGDILSIRFNV
jgi:GTP-binding protein YchF